MRSLDSAYELQAIKLRNVSPIGAYKVGASNKASADFFDIREILIGGIEAKNITYSNVLSIGGEAELEVCLYVEVGFNLKNHRVKMCRLGFEYPGNDSTNQQSDASAAVADNLSAYHLHILDFEVAGLKAGRVLVGDAETISFDVGCLLYDVDHICTAAVNLIGKHGLPYERGGFWIATGGLSPLIKINEGECVRLIS